MPAEVAPKSRLLPPAAEASQGAAAAAEWVEVEAELVEEEEEDAEKPAPAPTTTTTATVTSANGGSTGGASPTLPGRAQAQLAVASIEASERVRLGHLVAQMRRHDAAAAAAAEAEGAAEAAGRWRDGSAVDAGADAGATVAVAAEAAEAAAWQRALLAERWACKAHACAWAAAALKPPHATGPGAHRGATRGWPLQ